MDVHHISRIKCSEIKCACVAWHPTLQFDSFFFFFFWNPHLKLETLMSFPFSNAFQCACRSMETTEEIMNREWHISWHSVDCVLQPTVSPADDGNELTSADTERKKNEKLKMNWDLLRSKRFPRECVVAAALAQAKRTRKLQLQHAMMYFSRFVKSKTSRFAVGGHQMCWLIALICRAIIAQMFAAN